MANVTPSGYVTLICEKMFVIPHLFFYSRACVVYQWSVLFVLARAGHQLIATSTYSVIVTSVDEIQLQMLHRLSRIVLWRRQGVGV